MIQVGPVVGKVTSTSARILLEVDADTAITCSLRPTQNTGNQSPPLSLSKDFKALRPDVFVIKGLQPDTRYRATFDCTFPGSFQDFAEFRTPPFDWRLQDRQPKIAIVSCNKVFTTHRDVESSGDLWRDLALKGREGNLDMICHIGDNVYADSDLYLIEAGKKEYQGSGDCKFLEARQKLDNLSRDQWHTKYAAMCDIFRSIYRLTWGHPPTQNALASCANLMILDDHDIRDDWGDEPGHHDPQCIDRYVGLIAFQIYNEYQRRLYEDYTPPPEGLTPDQPQYLARLLQTPARSYHAHVFGELGILFIDVRAAKSFHYDSVTDEKCPFLGQEQWNYLTPAFSRSLEATPPSEQLVEDGKEGVKNRQWPPASIATQARAQYDPTKALGLFDSVRFLLVLVPVPVAYLSKNVTEMGAKQIDDLRGAWTFQNHCKETEQFLQSLLRWRSSARPNFRNLLIVGGDVHEGGMTEISIPKKALRSASQAAVPSPSVSSATAATSSSYKKQPRFFVQMTSSAISNSILPWYQAAAPAMARHLSHILPGGFTMKHLKWTHDRNYGTVQAQIDERDNVDFVTQIISSDGRNLTHHHELVQSQDFGKMPSCCG